MINELRTNRTELEGGGNGFYTIPIQLSDWSERKEGDLIWLHGIDPMTRPNDKTSNNGALYIMRWL